MPSRLTGSDVWTAANLVLIAIGAVLAVLVILWGAKMKRQRNATAAAIEDRAEQAPPPPPRVVASLDDITPGAPETDPVPRVAEPDASGDDLTTLKGVGPRLAARLGELGITRFAQIAALTPAEAAALDAQLIGFEGRLTRDRWIEQAGYLAKGDRAGFEAAFGNL